LEALDKIYNDYIGSVDDLRINALGNYLVTIKKNNKIVVFVDKYQVLKTYYYNIGKEWFLTNSLADIGSILDCIKINEFAFMQETMQIGALGTQSIFENVFQLYGNQYIEIDCESGNVEIKPIAYKRKRRNFENRSIDDIVDEYADMVKKKFSVVANIYGDNIRLHMTGGLDNRTVFAGLMSVGCKPKIMYGEGDSIITSTKSEDLECVETYEKKFGLDFHKMDWKYDYLSGEKDWEHLFSIYGFYYTIYGANKTFFNEYEGNIPNYPSFMECGYFGENLRLREWAQNQGQPIIDIEEFISAYQCSAAYGDDIQNTDFYPNANNYRAHLNELFKVYSKSYGIDIGNGVTIDEFDEVRQLQARIADSYYVNLLNEFSSSFAVFSDPDLYEFLFDVPAVYRANASFQLKLIEKLYPEALEIPFFSHGIVQNLDPVKMIFKKQPFKIYSLFHSLIKKQLGGLGKNKKILNYIKLIFFKLGYKKEMKSAFNENQLVKEHLVEIIKKNSEDTENYICAENFNGSTVYLMQYALCLEGIRLLRSSNEDIE